MTYDRNYSFFYSNGERFVHAIAIDLDEKYLRLPDIVQVIKCAEYEESPYDEDASNVFGTPYQIINFQRWPIVLRGGQHIDIYIEETATEDQRKAILKQHFK